MNGLRGAGALGALVLAGLAVVAVGAPQPPEAPELVRGVLWSAVWRGTGLGEELGGSACWLRGADGAVRIEFTREAAAGRSAVSPAWGRLLTRGGEGWVVLLAGETAVGGRWGGPLERLAPDLRLRLETLLAVMAGRGDDGCNLRLPETAPLRAALEARGRGRGGGGETWRVRRLAAPGAPGDTLVVLTSTRLPGRLQVRSTGSWPAQYAPDDVFVPVWSLGDLLVFPEGRPGAVAADSAPVTD